MGIITLGEGVFIKEQMGKNTDALSNGQLYNGYT